jgi:hypothetical protein
LRPTFELVKSMMKEWDIILALKSKFFNPVFFLAQILLLKRLMENYDFKAKTKNQMTSKPTLYQ